MMGIDMSFVAAQVRMDGFAKNKQVNLGNNGTSNKFGHVFSKIVANENPIIADQTAETGLNSEILRFLKEDSLEEVFNMLGITHDEGLFMISRGKEGKMAAIDELFQNFDDFLSLLNMDVNQLNEILQHLIGEETAIGNVWDFIQTINNSQLLADKIASILAGEERGFPKDAVQLLQFMKLVQMIGEKTDLTFDQPEQISNVKTILQNIAKAISQGEGKATSGKISLEGFHQALKQAQTKVEPSSLVSSTAALQGTGTRTATITLPNTDQTSQAQTLVKQIESLLGRSQISNAQGTTKLLIKLYPEHLGSVRIELVHRDGMISARLLASTSHAKELLDSQIQQLKQAFVQQNIQLERIDVQQSLQETDLRDQNFFNMLKKGHEQAEEDSDKESDDKQEDDKISFKDYLIDEEV